MGLFGGSSKSRTTTNQTNTTNTTTITRNVDNRQDNRQFIDNSDRSRTNIDARQDNRQFIDQSDRSRTNIDARQDNRQFIDESVSLGAGAINASGAVTITEIDGGAVEEAFDFAKTVAANSLTTLKDLADEVLDQTDVAFEEQNQRNLMIMAGVGLLAVVGISMFRSKAA